MVRFVVGPDGSVVPDIAERLPGRGMWVTAERGHLERAAEKGLFARAAKQAVRVPADLVDITERALAQRCAELLGMARRTGALVLGFDQVRDAARTGGAAVLLTAADASANAHAKGTGFAHGLPHVDWLAVAEMSLAVGRENVVHAALAPGSLTERFLREARRLRGFRGVTASADINPVRTTKAPEGAAVTHATGLPTGFGPKVFSHE